MNSNGIYVTVELYLFQVFVCFDSLMENVRVRRAGFVFRQEYDVALERYESFCFSFSQAIGLHWYTTLLASFRTFFFLTADKFETNLFLHFAETQLT